MLAAERRGVELFRFNTEDYPVIDRVVVDPADPAATVLLTDNDEVAIGNAKGIWLRRPRWPIVSPGVGDPLDRLFAQQEAIAAIGGMWRGLSAKYVSPADVMQAARWKVSQLRVATAVRMKVPQTLVTNDPGRAETFRSEGPTVAKAVAEGRVEIAGRGRVGETIDLTEAGGLEGLLATPVLFQRRVDKVADLRLTAVGSQLFAVRIVTPPGAPIDFRVSNPIDCEYAVVDLPRALAEQLQSYLTAFGLRFGAFDLALDRNGTYWFLECNPAGQWGWLEPPTGLDITGALLDLLMGPGAVA